VNAETYSALDVAELLIPAIADGECDLILDRMAEVIHARQRALYAIADAAALARLKVGDRVEVQPDGTRRSKWDYERGVVHEIKGKRLRLKLDRGGYLLCPPSMLRKLT